MSDGMSRRRMLQTMAVFAGVAGAVAQREVKDEDDGGLLPSGGPGGGTDGGSNNPWDAYGDAYYNDGKYGYP